MLMIVRSFHLQELTDDLSFCDVSIRGRWYKTFLGIIYAKSVATSMKLSTNYKKSGVTYAKKVLYDCTIVDSSDTLIFFPRSML